MGMIENNMVGPFGTGGGGGVPPGGGGGVSGACAMTYTVVYTEPILGQDSSQVVYDWDALNGWWTSRAAGTNSAGTYKILFEVDHWEMEVLNESAENQIWHDTSTESNCPSTIDTDWVTIQGITLDIQAITTSLDP